VGMHGELYWLDAPENITYKLGVMTIQYFCLNGQVPPYLADHLTSAAEVASRFRLRSAN